MPTLSPGTHITMSDGQTLTVLAYIASGGQGEVYKVRLEPGVRIMALKWYTDPKIIGSSGFISTLRYNSCRPSPSRTFLWPLGVTQRQHGSYGYIMPLMPDGYYDFGKFFCIDRYPDIYFRSELAKVTAALKICDAFSRLHLEGFSYQDINDGNFLINPLSGDVLICDTDNITVNDFNNGIGGKAHYMAPEVIAGHIPNSASDRFSLAIILYRIFMVDHPFEGRNTASGRYACLTPSDESRLFGIDAVFCHDRTDGSNRPVKELHPNSITFWPQIPALLRDAFCRALSRTAITDPSARLTATQWKNIMLRMRASLMFCRASKADPLHDFFADDAPVERCPRCGLRPAQGATLLFDDGLRYRITDGKPLYLADSFTPAGFGRRLNAIGGGMVTAIENHSGSRWRLITARGTQMDVLQGSMVQLVPGTTIDFGNIQAKIVQ